jgi:hypothetical protein
MLNLPESSPMFAIYDLSQASAGSTVVASDTPAMLTFQGYPLAPESESPVGQWMLPRARLYGYFDEHGRGIRSAQAGELRAHLLARGSLALRVTDSALRITVLDGKSPELGQFAAGRQIGFRPLSQARINTLSCVWALSDVWAVDRIARGRGRRAIRISGPSGPGLIIGRAATMQEAFLKRGLPTTSSADELADRVVSAIIEHARRGGDAARIAAADEVEAARRDSGRPLSAPARFRAHGRDA